MIKKCLVCGQDYQERALHVAAPPGPGVCPRCRTEKRRGLLRRLASVFKPKSQ